MLPDPHPGHHEAAIIGTGMKAGHWRAVCTCGWLGEPGLEALAVRDAWNHERRFFTPIERTTAPKVVSLGCVGFAPSDVQVERERLKWEVLRFCANKMHRPWLRELARLFA